MRFSTSRRRALALTGTMTYFRGRCLMSVRSSMVAFGSSRTTLLEWDTRVVVLRKTGVSNFSDRSKASLMKSFAS